MTDIAILDWKLVRLTIDQVGPFQETLETFDFTGPSDPEGSLKAPTNLFMLLAKNGKGKTTVLECIHGVMGLLAEPPVGRFIDRMLQTSARRQLSDCSIAAGAAHPVVISCGSRPPRSF